MILLTRTRDDQSPPIKNRKQHRDIPSSGEVCNPSSRPGKVHGSVLPQEYELERLVADVLHPDPSWTTSTAACNWARVGCNEHGEVTELQWHTDSDLDMHEALFGTLHLEHLPRTILRVSASVNKFSGSDCFSTLPPSLTDLELRCNAFTGMINFSDFPSKLQVIRLGYNKLEGEVDLGGLPTDLNTLDKDTVSVPCWYFFFSSSFLSPATGILLLYFHARCRPALRSELSLLSLKQGTRFHHFTPPRLTPLE